jgi:hypothetical protein
MPRNGSGTYALPSGNPVTSGTTISATTHNATNTDIATALTDSIDKDGQTVITGAIDHNGNEIILDVDGDTSIHASTDDQIDIKVAGADDFVITANKFDVLAGSELKVNGQLELTKGADIASPGGGALAVDIDGNFFDVTGTNAITSLVTRGVGSIIALHFDGALVFTHDATNLILPGAANITTAAGDIALLYEYAAADWRVISYTKASGKAVVSGGNVYIPEAAAATADVAGSIQLWNKNTGTGLLHVTDDAGTDKEVSLVGNNIFINETAAAAGDTAGVGQLWVDDAVPNTIMFTNDAGTDQLIYTATTLPTSQYQTVMGSVTATTSGTTKDFTSIPAGVKKIAMQFEGMSTNGTSDYLLQLGDAGGIETSGYVAVATNTFDGTTPSGTSGFTLSVDVAAATTSHGWVEIKLLDAGTFTWVLSGSLHQTGQALTSMAGSKALSAELTQVRLTSVSPDTFDAGKVNIQYSF